MTTRLAEKPMEALVRKRIGEIPILQTVIQRLRWREILLSYIPSHGNETVPAVDTLLVLVWNIACGRQPLYELPEWVAKLDSRLLGHVAEVSCEELYGDDRFARALDKLYAADRASMVTDIALRLIETTGVKLSELHNDSTTVKFCGQYRNAKGRKLRGKRAPAITYGYSKDHRPDLKQLVFGLNVTADGAVPISHDVYSGNRTDDTIHRSNVDSLRQVLGCTDFIYVADSKLATRKNLAHVAKYGGKFVTVLPRTRVEDKRFRKSLREGAPVRWRKLVEIENHRRKSDPPDVYYSTADGPGETSEGYRIVWNRSSQKTELDALARETSLKKAEAELFDLNTRLNLSKLRKRPAIRKKVTEILAKHNCRRFLKVRIASKTHIETKRQRRGRPKKNDPVKRVRTRVYHLEVSRNKEPLRAEARTDGVFPLTTNLETTKAPKKEVLLIYKYQPYVEKRHALFKKELEVAPVYIKKPLRAVGLIHAVFLSMMLDALIERTVRLNMIRDGIEALPILPEGRETKTPTTARILEMFSSVCWYEFERGDETVTFPIQLSELQKQLLRLLDMAPSAYA